jgi:diacylglycerol kinase
MIAWLKRLLRSFLCAGRGLARVVFTQRNARIHATAALAVVVLGCWLRITRLEWCLVVLSCGLVVSAEAMNCAVETLADRVTLERDEKVRDAKDAAAGATLIASCAAAIVGVIVFGPRLMELFSAR